MFSSLFNWLMGAGRELAVVLISMIPLVELRGCGPAGRGRRRAGDRADPAGCDRQYDPDPVFAVFGEKLLDWVCSLGPLSGFATKYREKLLGKTGQVTRYERLGLFLFVAIPLPGTGAWSGALIATLLKMPKTKALTSILCGVIVAGFIMLLGSQGVIGVAHLF